MIRSTVSFALLLVLTAGAARAEGARAFVEIAVSKDAVFVNEPVTLRVRVGVDRTFFEEHAVPLFRQRMDVPVQVAAPWLDALPGAVRVETSASSARASRLVLGARVAGATEIEDVVRDGRTYRTLELSATWQFEVPGEVELAAPTLRFAWATRFEEDFLGDRVAVDRKDETVKGEARTLRVLAWPEAERPTGFVDAVGRFRVRAEAVPVEGGEALRRLTLTIEGEGNLQTLTPPTAERIEGFHVYGAIDDPGVTRRTITYDIAPLDEAVKAIPSIPFAFLDPGPPARYRVVGTESIPLEQRERPTEAEGAGVGEPYEFSGWKGKLFGFALVVFLVLAGVVWTGLKKSPSAVDTAERERALTREAADALRRAVAERAPDLEARLTAYLAARLGTTPAAVITPDLASRLAKAGVDGDTATRTASLLERLVAARYGGSPVEVDAALVDALDLAD